MSSCLSFKNLWLSLVFLLVSSLAHAGIEEDKLLHFSFSFGFGASFGMIYSPQKACAISLIPGIAKEIYDKLDYGLFSFEDIVADAVGGCIGAYVSSRFNKQLKKYKELNNAPKGAGDENAKNEINAHILPSCPDDSVVRVCNAKG